MGQKINPILLRLGSNSHWDSRYIEKKLPELSYYTFSDLEIKTFTVKFFKDNGMIINKLFINHSHNSLHLFISYYLSFQSSFYKDIKNKKIKPTVVNNIPDNIFIKKFLNSFKLANRTKNKIFLTLEQINNNSRKTIFKNKIKSIKKSLIQLRKFKQYDFFKEGINILFSTIKNKNGSELLTKFISTQIKKFKRHNFFLRFIKTSLSLLVKQKFSRLKSIKIKIKGRLNGRPRARHRIIKIKNGVPVLSISSNISYSESTAFTSNGTIGVKVWLEIYKKDYAKQT